MDMVDRPTTNRPKKRKGRHVEEEEDKLCCHCKSIFTIDGIVQLNSSSGHEHHLLSQLMNCAESSRCPVCQFLANRVRGTLNTDSESRLIIRNKTISPEQETGRIDVLCVQVEGLPEEIRLYPFAKADDPAGKLVLRRPLNRNVATDGVFASARKHIQACLGSETAGEGHQMCRHSRDKVLPTRVLLLSWQRNGQAKLRLQVNEVETRGSYLALSYCWGQGASTSASLFALSRNNASELERNIYLEKLPKTIQDAVQVTLKLGFQYLWVDAFCIIQDDDDDKAREISRMATIYKNATVTIAASVSDHSSKGFLKYKKQPYLPLQRVPYDGEIGQTGRVYLSMGYYEPNHPLDKRGWTLQEFMLSSRLLIFSDYELLWQCRETSLRSVTGNAAGLEYLQPLEELPWTVFRDGSEPDFGSHETEKFYIWVTVIRQFTSRELGQPDDRLPAVKGMMTELESLWSDRQLFGHWTKWFVQLLAWFKPIGLQVANRQLHRAPSWSWASVDGVVHYEAWFDKKHAYPTALSMSEVKLLGRLLMSHKVSRKRLDSVTEIHDLSDEAFRREIGHTDLGFFLLGTARDRYDRERGISLVLLRNARGHFRRVGLAISTDVEIWSNVERKEIVLEGKST